MSQKDQLAHPKGQGALIVYNALKDDIIHARVAPAARIDEAAVLRRFQVSRTPVREALARLELEGLVERSPRSGLRAARLTDHSLNAFLEGFSALGLPVVRIAAQRRTSGQLAQIADAANRFAALAARTDPVAMAETSKAFYAAIARAAQNPFFEPHFRALLDERMRIFIIAAELCSDEERRQAADLEQRHNERILRAIEKAEPAIAEKAFRQHLELVSDRIDKVRLKALEEERSR